MRNVRDKAERDIIVSPFILLLLIVVIVVGALGYMTYQTYRSGAERRAREKRRNQLTIGSNAGSLCKASLHEGLDKLVGREYL